MKNTLICSIFLVFPIFLFSQPNCEIMQDSLCKQACTRAVIAEKYQGYLYFQHVLDTAIAECSSLDYAYKEKAVPYLKSGDFSTWKKLIEKAVEINPKNNLGYRGWCKYQFLNDYKGAIEDIENLELLVTYDIGYCQTGEYHLLIAKALAYQGIGEYEKAIRSIESLLTNRNYQPLFYDYLSLGVLYLQTGKTNKAIKALQKQIKIHENLAENYYYLALAYKQKGDNYKYIASIERAKELYALGSFMKDPYTHPMNRVFFQEISKKH